MKIYYTIACQGMSALAAAGASGPGIAVEWTSNIGGFGTINVSSCTTSGCLGGFPTCGRLMSGWDIL